MENFWDLQLMYGDAINITPNAIADRVIDTIYQLLYRFFAQKPSFQALVLIMRVILLSVCYYHYDFKLDLIFVISSVCLRNLYHH